MSAQSRMTKEFIAADDTTAFEQESIRDGENRLLLNTTAYVYDEQQQRASLIRRLDVLRAAFGNKRGRHVIVTPESITTYTRDAAGRTLTTRRENNTTGQLTKQHQDTDSGTETPALIFLSNFWE